ncbi:aldo/keto reductase [Streptomyces sp. S.PNR 29]|uniref:aldo/keto reductase n=1 Tax=Streptomyces sp. S.PNR 29 TaxID=2973805 RepID=UPI0025AF5331|nr:aldo/keto reductase [Streptomyces sp. S.PNR 29]MDN0193885.1 aldo/keto reductase [Streptomyces sp. S.PNR 29]
MRTPDRRIVLGLHRSRHERRQLIAALDLGITGIDTAFNYHRFTSHTSLANVGRGLLDRFTISTKVGFFPGHDQAEHSLAPASLLEALEQTNRDLGRAPDLVFLHNPERSLREAAPDLARDTLAQACAAMEEAKVRGLCRAWGASAWHPSPLLHAIDPTVPKPAVLMIRCGLFVGFHALKDAASLAERWSDHTTQLWGMSPFGGNANNPVWSRFDARVFLRNWPDHLTQMQAAFRTAFHLPHVNTVAVGTDDPTHLRDLVDVLSCEVDEQAVVQYRNLLHHKAQPQPA